MHSCGGPAGDALAIWSARTSFSRSSILKPVKACGPVSTGEGSEGLASSTGS